MKIQIEVTAPRWLTLGRRFRKLKAAGIALSVALIAGVPVAWASHVFTDVPGDHPFHDPISAIRGAGITTGCQAAGEPARYCPDDYVRRGAMAAFMHRGNGRVAQSQTIADTTIGATDSAVAQVTITVPGAGAGASQFVKLDGSVRVYNGTAGAFPVWSYLAAGGCTGSTSPYFAVTLASGYYGVLSPTWVVPAAPGARTFVLCAFHHGAAAATVDVQAVSLNASTFPFGSTGTATLSSGTARS